MKVRSAITKGRNFQKKIANILLKHLAPLGNPPFDETDIHSVISAQRGSDVVMTSRVLSVFPFDVECKKMKKVDLFAAMEQSYNRLGKRLPIVIAEQNNKPACVMISQTHALFYPVPEMRYVSFDWTAPAEMTPYEMWLEDNRCSKEPIGLHASKDGRYYKVLDFHLWIEHLAPRLRSV